MNLFQKIQEIEGVLRLKSFLYLTHHLLFLVCNKYLRIMALEQLLMCKCNPTFFPPHAHIKKAEGQLHKTMALSLSILLLIYSKW